MKAAATATYFDPWAGPIAAQLVPFRTKRKGETVIRYRWQAVKGQPYEISLPLQTERGDWICAARWADTGDVFANASGSDPQEIAEQLAGVLDFAVAARRITGPAFPPAATEPTPEGLQYVMPGCEKDQARGPAQMSLF